MRKIFVDTLYFVALYQQERSMAYESLECSCRSDWEWREITDNRIGSDRSVKLFQ